MSRRHETGSIVYTASVHMDGPPERDVVGAIVLRAAFPAVSQVVVNDTVVWARLNPPGRAMALIQEQLSEQVAEVIGELADLDVAARAALERSNRSARAAQGRG